MSPIAILTADQECLRGQLRAVLGELDAAIAGVGATVEDRAVLVEAVRGLDELFLLVVVGEFNAGKSALLNELIGARILEEGVTPADRRLTETERELLDHIRAWGKKVVVVINKIDLLESPEALQQVVEFVRDGLRSTLDLTPPIFAVSVRLARAAAETHDLGVA